MFLFLIMCIAIIAGSMIPLQAGVNSSLAKMIGNPYQAALISFFGGVVVMVTICLITGQLIPKAQKVSTVPPYLFIGGLLGTFMVVSAIFLAPRLGATLWISCLLAGQLFASVLLDHYGWLGFEVHPLNVFRVLGLSLLIMGITLIRFF